MQRSAPLMVLALASLALAGCLGSPAPAPEHPAAAPRAGDHAPVPPALRAAVEASVAGRLPGLQGLVGHAEAFRGLPSLPEAAPAPGDLAEALLALAAHDGIAPTPAFLEGLAGLAALPRDLQDALAVLAAGTLASSALSRAAFEGAPVPLDEAHADRVDWALALRALRLKLAAAEAAIPALRAHAGGLPGAGVLDLCGSVGLDLAGVARTWSCNYTLLVDLGGDDVHLGNAGGTHTIYASPLHLEVAGHDRYLSQVADHTAVTGGAVSGVGTLIDLAGDDVYDTFGHEGSGQNGGVQGGVGFLADLAGRDTVRATGMLHSGVNGAAWIGHGTLVLVGGDDAVDGWTEGAGALNGAGLLGTGLVLGLGEGDRTYRAEDGGQPFGGTSNGGGVGGGTGTMLDHGGDTRYEAWMSGGAGAANGGGRAGNGALLDLGGGDDHYLVRMAPGSGVNGGGVDAAGLLFDDGGTDTYDEGPEALATDATVAPKGLGAQVDASNPVPRGGAGAAAGPGALAPWPEAARPVARALVAAHEAGFTLASLHQLSWALAGLPGTAPRDPLPAPEALPALVARFLASRGGALDPADAALLAALPMDLQRALATLLAGYLAAADLAAQAAPATEDAPPGPEALRARGLLFEAVERARPVLARYADRPMAARAVDVCGVLNLDLTSMPATYVCNYLFQVSLGGASVYRNNAGGSLRGEAGFLLDAGGDDQYLGDHLTEWYGVAGGGSGVTGLGFLAELAGNDRYAPACSRGCSAMGGADSGVGALVDYDGNDQHLVVAGQLAAATGGGIVGRGFLADFEGLDSYVVMGPQHTAANGGAIFGNGFLFDRWGDDLYHAVTGEHGPVNGAATIGSGMLLDMAGNDRYHAESGHHAMVNGAAFWGTPGAFLIDAGGDDNYTAISGMGPYANGRYFYPGTCPAPRTGCARGASALVDLGGRDAYLEWATGMGHAHGHGGHGRRSHEAPPEPAEEPAPGGCDRPPGHENHTTHEHPCGEAMQGDPGQECQPPPGHEEHTTHGHDCEGAMEECQPPPGHERHAHPHACGADFRDAPPPAWDTTEAPKGDAGAQLDLEGAGFAATFRALAGP